jgi:hypothetical protein
LLRKFPQSFRSLSETFGRGIGSSKVFGGGPRHVKDRGVGARRCGS